MSDCGAEGARVVALRLFCHFTNSGFSFGLGIISPSPCASTTPNIQKHVVNATAAMRTAPPEMSFAATTKPRLICPCVFMGSFLGSGFGSGRPHGAKMRPLPGVLDLGSWNGPFGRHAWEEARACARSPSCNVSLQMNFSRIQVKRRLCRSKGTVGWGAGSVRPRGAALGGVGVMPRLMRGDGEKDSRCRLRMQAAAKPTGPELAQAGADRIPRRVRRRRDNCRFRHQDALAEAMQI